LLIQYMVTQQGFSEFTHLFTLDKHGLDDWTSWVRFSYGTEVFLCTTATNPSDTWIKQYQTTQSNL